jgi:hypothetical protein
MPFIVTSNSQRPGEGTFRAHKKTRKDAFETAIGLMGQGMEGVTITDTDQKGRIYQPPEFAKFVIEEL